MKKGYAAFLVDQPRRGEAGSTASMTAEGFLDAWAEDSKDYKAVDAAALGEVLADVYEMTGNKSIFVPHSQGGAVGWDVPVENIAAIVAIEPGGTPEVDSEQYQKLLEAGIPITIYFGDYIDNGPEDIMSTGFWAAVRDGAGEQRIKLALTLTERNHMLT